MDIKLLKEISETPGISGFEDPIRKVILREVESLVDEVQIDNMGNLLAIKKGTSNKKLMVTAHMDEIGFVVSHIDDQGFLRFVTVGGFDPKTLSAQRVTVHGKTDLLGVMGAKPIHRQTATERKTPAKLEDFFIDLGMTKEEVVAAGIRIGTPVTRERTLEEIGNCVTGKSLDNRVSVYILIEVLKKLKTQKIPFDLYAAFTVQEEVGLRGARVSAHQVEADFGINIDTTVSVDIPGTPAQEVGTKLGSGVGIKVLDSAVICDQRMVEFMISQAEISKQSYQLEVLKGGGTDTASLQMSSPGGTIAGAMSVPTRHIHQVVEMCNKQDIEDSTAFLTNLIKNLDEFQDGDVM